MIYPLLRPALFRIDPERAHRLSIAALKLKGARHAAPTPALRTTVAGLEFPNPLGMAAGFDKDADVPDAVLGLGFGFTEVGTIPPLPQPGNARPRLFRLVEDKAVINRFGFNSQGGAVAAERLRRRAGRGGIVGINIGANKESHDRIADYAAMARLMAPLASYLAVNVSSPNTPGLRALQDEGALRELLDGVCEARGQDGVPVFLKVAPDLEPADITSIVRVAADKRLGAIMIGNTTVTRPPLRSRQRGEAGGLSGAPLKPLALKRLRDFRRESAGVVPLVGIGGIATAEDAWQRICAGADLIQLYSAMVYEGPSVARSIVAGLERRLQHSSFGSIAEAVGSAA